MKDKGEKVSPQFLSIDEIALIIINKKCHMKGGRMNVCHMQCLSITTLINIFKMLVSITLDKIVLWKMSTKCLMSII